MPLVKARPGQANRASSVPVEEQPPTLAMNPGLRASSLPPELETTETPDSPSRRSSTSSWKSWRHRSSSSVSVVLPPPPSHKEPRLGTLVTVVLRARHLPDKHVCSKQNVYTTVSFCGETLRTKVDVRGGQHPEWDEQLEFGVWSETADAMKVPPYTEDGVAGTVDAKLMKISIWEDKKGPDLLVGEGFLDVSQALLKGEFDEWIPLSREGTQRGEIFLELTYFSAGLPQITPRPFSADFKGYAIPEPVAKNMSYIVAPTPSMIAVAPVIEPGTPRQIHRASLPPLPTFAAASSVPHGYPKSVAGPIHSKLTKQRPASLQMDGLPSIAAPSVSRLEAVGMPGNFCNSPVDSPTPTQAKAPANGPISAEQGSAPTLASEEHPTDSWTSKMTSLIHGVAEKLHIHHEEHEELSQSQPDSEPASPSGSDTASAEDDLCVPGGF